MHVACAFYFICIKLVKLIIINKYFYLFFCAAANQDDSSDYEGYEEKEASRTHSVKFSEDSATDKEVSFIVWFKFRAVSMSTTIIN